MRRRIHQRQLALPEARGGAGRSGRAIRRHLTVLVVVSLVGGACEEAPDLALGPPRCEPARELDHERHLKDGFRALYEGDLERAKASFGAVEGEEPGHPEAALGLRLAGKARSVPPSKSSKQSGLRREVLVAGERFEVPLEVVVDSLRFEGLAELRAARGEARDTFGPRMSSGEPVDPTRVEGARAAVELIVLHDTRTATRAERVAALDEAGGSVHFIVDWDGRVYQVLDLALAARHTLDPRVDSRSIGIELVNPVALDKSGALPDGTERKKSGRVTIQGEDVEHWGYTEAQLASLESLLDGLLVIFPQVARRVPEGDAGVVPRVSVTGGDIDLSSGIVGHLHLSRGASDPGAAFPWERLAEFLAR